MATVSEEAVQNNGRPTAVTSRTIMVRQIAIATEGDSERMMHQMVPAWVISSGIHLALAGIFAAYQYFFGGGATVAALENQVLETRIDDPKQEQQNFENTDVGLDPTKETNYNLDRIENVSVPGIVRPNEAVGIVGAPEGPPQTLPPPPGFGGGQGGGILSTDAGTGQMFGEAGGWMGGRSLPGTAFNGRSGATRQKMLQEGGGNNASEAAVAKGLKWLQRQQKGDGRWVLDGTVAYADDSAATGLALLPFLAAGQTHRPMKGEKESIYAKTVQYGLDYLRSKQKANGSFNCRQLYGEAIATMALCEAYGMTKDQALMRPAQLGLDYLVKAQHAVGGFRYRPGDPGDTSVTGWCCQALQSGYLAGLSVPKDTLYKISNFLNTCQTQDGAAYGYTGPGNSANLTAVCLLCRQYIDQWGPKNPKLIAGVENLKRNSPRKGQGEIYYYYYATQVVHFFGGDDWTNWNLGMKGPDGQRKQGMRDLLIDTQNNTTTPNNGSWEPDTQHTGRSGGRLTCTCLSLLTLEVYYRHLPLYRPDTSGLKLD